MWIPHPSPLNRVQIEGKYSAVEQSTGLRNFSFDNLLCVIGGGLISLISLDLKYSYLWSLPRPGPTISLV